MNLNSGVVRLKHLVDVNVEVVIHGRRETTIYIKKQKTKYELKYLELQELLPGHSPSYKISM